MKNHEVSGTSASEMEGLRKSFPELILFAEIERCSVFEHITVTVGSSHIIAAELGPFNSDFRIIPGKAPLIAGVIKVCHLIAEFRCIAQYKEAVGKSLGDIELFFVFFGPSRRSTATSNTSPRMTLTSFPCGNCFWK